MGCTINGSVSSNQAKTAFAQFRETEAPLSRLFPVYVPALGSNDVRSTGRNITWLESRWDRRWPSISFFRPTAGPYLQRRARHISGQGGGIWRRLVAHSCLSKFSGRSWDRWCSYVGLALSLIVISLLSPVLASTEQSDGDARGFPAACLHTEDVWQI